MEPFEFDQRIRYYELDPQGVVFNAWYLAWFDEALGAYLQHRGLDLEVMQAEGFDVQLVHADVDWMASLRHGDPLRIAVSTARLGNTSFAIDYEARSDGTVACSARIVYVVINTDGSGKRELPEALLRILGAERPQRT